MTYVDASAVGAGSPDGSTVYLTSNDLVYVTAPGITIDALGSGNEVIATNTADIPIINSGQPVLVKVIAPAGDRTATVTVLGGVETLDPGVGITASDVILHAETQAEVMTQ